MAEINKAPRGTADVLPADSADWQYVEDVMLRTAELYGFRELRTPVFEHTEVFTRSVGDTTDVVQKEMYTFEDKGGRSITLRPEGTAGAVRAIIEHGLTGEALPLKCSYLLSCYRYEKPQAGRLREFHQFGVECFGADQPAADAEIILLGAEILRRLSVKNVTLEINSIGCPVCRAEYHKALTAYFEGHKDRLCATCLDRLTRNPMRILDCKSPVCSEIAAGAPVMLEYLDEDCKAHFEQVQEHLNEVGLHYVINPRIVRGLDYYTRTVFEFVSGDIGAQGTVCAGGRYDGLVEQMGGPKLPSLGFALGIERLLLVMKAGGAPFPGQEPCAVYIAPLGDAAKLRATVLCANLRDCGISAQTDLTGRSVKAQMKYASKLGARFTLVIGDDELATGSALLRNMQTGETTPCALSDLPAALTVAGCQE